MGGLIEALFTLAGACLMTFGVYYGFQSGNSLFWRAPMYRTKHPAWFWVGQALTAVLAVALWSGFLSVLGRHD